MAAHGHAHVPHGRPRHLAHMAVEQRVTAVSLLFRHRVMRGVLVSRAARWLCEAATTDTSGTTFNRMVDVMDQIVEAAAAL